VEDEVVEGQVLAGKYRVERILGVGGMGVVVSAHHLQLDERVALKFMLREARANGEAVARFAREARAAVKIKSEHVARVSDVGVLDSGAPYMVMEHLEGSDLSGWLKQHGRLPMEQAVEFVLQASEALAEAHSLGIVHRDLKPANLFVIRRPDGALSVKVLDFGISKVTAFGGAGPDFGMTKTSALMGSPLYMSPEQMRSAKDADTRSDIWALGVILFELLSGVTPFAAEALPELVLRIVSDAPQPLRIRAPEVPLRLEAVILKCLAKDPEQRFATVGELAVALVEFAPPRSRISVERIAGVLKGAGLAPSALVPPRATPSTGPSAVRTITAWGQTASVRSSGKRVLLSVGAVLSVTAMAFTAYSFLRERPKTAASAEPTAAASPAAPAAPAASAVAAAAPPVATPSPVGLSPSVTPEAKDLHAAGSSAARPLGKTTARASSSAKSRNPALVPAPPAVVTTPVVTPPAAVVVTPPAAVVVTPPAAAGKPKPAATNNVFDDR
jgi:eukaryotic-like serine/threonine-protein kinase